MAALERVIGWRLAGSVAGVVACYAVYYAWVYRHLRGTEPTPTLVRLNVGLENSLVSILFVLDVVFSTPEQALYNPIPIIAAGIIILSALRSDPRLPLFAASITALELLLLYAFVAYPRLATPVPLLQVRPEDRPQRGNHLEDLLRALPGPVAPYPYGQAALAHAIRDALARRQGGVRPPLPPNAVPPPSENTPSWDATTNLRTGGGD